MVQYLIYFCQHNPKIWFLWLKGSRWSDDVQSITYPDSFWFRPDPWGLRSWSLKPWCWEIIDKLFEFGSKVRWSWFDFHSSYFWYEFAGFLSSCRGSKKVSNSFKPPDANPYKISKYTVTVHVHRYEKVTLSVASSTDNDLDRCHPLGSKDSHSIRFALHCVLPLEFCGWLQRRGFFKIDTWPRAFADQLHLDSLRYLCKPTCW